MKTSAILSMILLVHSLGIMAQSNGTADHIWTWEGRKKVNTLGVFGTISGSYTQVMDKPAAWFGAKAGVVINRHWGVGLAGYALNYDRQLDEVVTDGTYRLQAGYSGMFVEYFVPLSNWGKLSFSWTSGMGKAFYQYNKAFREDRPWYDEVIDLEKLVVNDLGINFKYRMVGNWWIGANASYGLTSPVNLTGADEYFLRNYRLGIDLSYGIF